jgi:hypothetical protein
MLGSLLAFFYLAQYCSMNYKNLTQQSTFQSSMLGWLLAFFYLALAQYCGMNFKNLTLSSAAPAHAQNMKYLYF